MRLQNATHGKNPSEQLRIETPKSKGGGIADNIHRAGPETTR